MLPGGVFMPVVPPERTILIVEDDKPLAKLIGQVLRIEGFVPHFVHRGDQALAALREVQPDLVLLDLMLPGLDGFSVCREARAFYRGPILMLTARGDELDQVVGLEVGADDYVIKPVVPRVLVARIRALLRRVAPTPGGAERLRAGRIVVERPERRAFVDERELQLSTSEYDLLAYLVERARTVVDRDALYLALRGIPYDGLDRSIDLRVSRVRTAIHAVDPDFDPILTVRGCGYLLRADA